MSAFTAMPGGRLKAELQDNFEVREEENLRFKNNMGDMAVKVAQLEFIVQRQNKELQAYQKRLGISKQDALDIYTNAQKAVNGYVDTRVLGEEETDHLYALMRAVDERTNNFELSYSSQNKAIENYKRSCKTLTEDNKVLREELTRKTKELSDALERRPGTLAALDMIQLQQLKEENAMLEEESQKLYEFLEDLSHKNELLSKENKSLKQIEGNEVSRAAGSVDNKEFIDTKYKLKAATLEIQDLTKQRDSLMYECADLKAELENLKGQVRTANTQAKMLQDQVDLYNSGDNELAMKSKKRLEEAQQEIDRWVAKAQELSVEKSSLVNELAQCREDSISLHETQAKMETEQVELRKLIEIIDEKNFNAQETISRLRSQIEVLEERSKDVSRREGQMAATEQRYQALVAELTANISSESKNANAKFTQLLDSARDKFGQQIRDKEEEIKDLSYKLAQLNLKADRLDLENRGLRDLQEKLATVQSTHDDKDEVILGLNKKIAELTSQNESISRKARDQELKRITHVVSPGTKDESYKRLEEELLKYKSQVEVIKLEQNRLQETIKRKDRAIAFLEEDRVNSMKRTTELHSLSNNEYLRDIEVKDKELAEVRKKFAEFKSDVETKMIKHEQLEEQLLLHSKNTIRNYEQKIQKLAQENDDLRHKYSLLESMVS